MKEFNIDAPAHLEDEIKYLADIIGVSAEELVSYFFAKEVVHT